jgi:hypothetical protein
MTLSCTIKILPFSSSFWLRPSNSTCLMYLYIYIYKKNHPYCRKNNSFILLHAENVGLSLSYGLSLNGVLFWAIYMSCLVENRMVSVERIKQFTKIPSEAAWEINDRIPPPNWPAHGNIDLKDLQVTGL